jgi:U3 small nucleolar RNA-associated protein 22
MDFGTYECISRGIVSVLTMALGDRVKEIRLLTCGNGEVRKVKDSSSTDSDEIHRRPVVSGGGSNKQKSTAHSQDALGLSPTGSEWAVIGFTFNSETCTRVVDRGPPAEDVAATDDFVRLWGKTRAQLRRFKDGAIVHAVVWDSAVEVDENVGVQPYIRFENDDKLHGGIVERIVRHILRLHFLGNPKTPPTSLEFSLRGMLSLVDGVLHGDNETSSELKRFDPLSAHRMAIKAFDSLSDFLRKHSLRTEPAEGTAELASRLGIPLAIDAVEPVSPALRYAELYPPLPHPFLGSPAASIPKENKIPGAVLSDPIEIQIRFGPSSKWPTDIRAIGAAKTAMLVRIVDGIESMKKTGYGGSSLFYGSPCVTSAYADVAWMGYVFRIRVRADPELKMLRSLNKPTDEASSLLRELTRQHLVAPSHHTMILSVYTSHPTASAVTRLAKRWLASHLLSGHIPFEAIELLVASVYSSRETTAYPPGSVITGFVRFLRLLGTHDWARQPLLVDPHGILSNDSVKDVSKQFEQIRGPEFDRGPAMYLISPYDKQHDSGVNADILFPIYTTSTPERVALARASKLAERSYNFLRGSLRRFESEWSPAFLESKTSFQSFSALLRVNPEFIVDPHSSSSGDNVLSVARGPASKLESSFTRSMRSRFRGPKELERKAYRNITDRDEGNIILHWNPIDSIMQNLSSRLHRFALFFYNELCPNVISVVWRPLFEPRGFSATVSEYARPITADEWKQDTLVTINVRDLLREIAQYTADIVVDAKLLDSGLSIVPPTLKRKQAEPSSDESDDSSSAGSAESESSELEE